MTKFKFDIINPNLYVYEDNSIYFSADDMPKIISVSESIDEIVKKQIGELKVTESDLECMKLGKCDVLKKEKYTIPLSTYLNCDLSRPISLPSSRLFGVLGYRIIASVSENHRDVVMWLNIKEDLDDPEKKFNEIEKEWDEKCWPYFRIDREKTLNLMRETYNELDQKILDNDVVYLVSDWEFNNTRKLIGNIELVQLKSKDKSQIEETRSQIVDILKKVDGPCLSLDTPSLLQQVKYLYEDAPTLKNKYGDILLDSKWKSRVFKFDF